MTTIEIFNFLHRDLHFNAVAYHHRTSAAFTRWRHRYFAVRRFV